ncbi:MAG: YtfJ family protein [Halioglobus sp.]
MSYSRLILITFTLLLSVFVRAESPTIDAKLPTLAIEKRGELHLEGDDINYKPWTSTENPGQVHIVQYLAATRSASKVYRPLTDKLADNYTHEDFHITTIINLDDAMWGTGGMVVSEVEDSKREFPNSTLVLDEKGSGRSSWSLEKKGAALAILNKDGTVLHFTQQPMDDAVLQQLYELVESQIEVN